MFSCYLGMNLCYSFLNWSQEKISEIFGDNFIRLFIR